MRKIIKIILLIIVHTIFYISFINSALGSNTWYTGDSDLYKQIDAGVNKLEKSIYKYEISAGGGSIKTEVNRILKEYNLPACIEKEITPEELKEISKGNLGLLSEKIGTKCLSKKKKAMSIADFKKIQIVINDINITSQKKAEKKADILNKISQIGLYSDGNLDNSPFDLISDMQKINEIIFSEKIKYKGEVNYDLEGLFDDFLKEKAEESKSNRGNEIPSASTQKAYSCLDSINRNAGISNDFSDILSSNVSNNLSGLAINESTNYNKVTDNNIWPCKGFFCINIDFITYNNKLLGGGGDYTIESVIKRSNKHLKKFTNSSLAQSKMGINLGELTFGDLSFPDSFHVGLVVKTKPIPILDIEPEGKKDKGEFSYENILYASYKNLGLDYKRKNSLVKFHHDEIKLKSILDSSNRSITMAENKQNNYIKSLELQKLKNKFIDKAIGKKILTEEMDNIYYNLAEIERFIGGLNSYTTGLIGAVRGMDRIPVKN